LIIAGREAIDVIASATMKARGHRAGRRDLTERMDQCQ